ncbi:tyrosine-type recombinase/integrase [Arthrobacter roseus]|uniref:tyrosine-type recombinase/integrase n=1 Tax=Arthrobacter roseus TaxID=136274 RepID=UPI0019626F2B|nr:site-specific integrase [Arthrobacter roseus]MBM7848810.1 integrase [Arthrobacter roseus]
MTVYDSRKERLSAGIGSPSKPWVADFRLPGGGRKRKPFRLKKEAEAYESAERSKINAGSYIDPRSAEKMTVGQLYADWMQRLVTAGARGRKPIAASTQHNYEKNWARHIAPQWEHTPVSNVHHREVARWVAGMDFSRAVGSGANTRRRVALMFGRLMNHAVYLELLSSNPAKDATGRAEYVPAASVVKQHVYLTMPELQAFAARCEPWEDLIMLAGTTGLRWGEITALRHGDFKTVTQPNGTEATSLRVARAWSNDGSKVVESTTKSGETRTVPVPTKVAQMLSNRREGSGLLFQSRHGAQLHHSNFASRILRPAGAGMDTPPTFHDLRHTAVSLILANTGNVKMAQRIAGHKDATMTLNVYAELFEGDAHIAADALDYLIR